jgi:hypothetical protein
LRRSDIDSRDAAERRNWLGKWSRWDLSNYLSAAAAFLDIGGNKEQLKKGAEVVGSNPTRSIFSYSGNYGIKSGLF